ncbi:MAG: hypothetical protein LBM64_02970 [Deltaproteobacteria bacterium]|jgi:hypothetical protein|nr:hypothetical protein [Deltaproteobacteria bacterium]
MANKKIKCENCGFEEELTSAQFNERKAAPGTCEQCGAELKLEGGAKGKAGAEADEVRSDAAPAEAAPEESKRSAKQTAEAVKENAKQVAEAARDNARQAAEAARAKFRQASQNPEFLAGGIDCCLKTLTGLASFDCLDKQTPKLVGLGHLALLLLALLSLVMGVIMSIRLGSLQTLGVGLGAAVFLILAQYLAVKSFQLFDGLIAANPSRLTGPALPAIVAVLDLFCAVGGIAMIVVGLVSGFRFSLIGFGLLLTLFSFLTAALFMQAEKQLNLSFDQSTSLGEQWLSLLSLHIKASVKLVPFAYGIGLAVMTVMSLPPLLIMLVRGAAAQGSLIELPCLLLGALLFALAPVLVYVAAMLTYLTLDLLRAILSLGKK